MKKFRYNYWSANTTLSETSKLRHKLHQLIYNNVDKIHRFDKDGFEQLKLMIKSKDPNANILSLGLVTNGKFTPKQATYLVYNCEEVLSPDFTKNIEANIEYITSNFTFNKNTWKNT
jgi:hypothetical protein